jgi:hypothetical protein
MADIDVDIYEHPDDLWEVLSSRFPEKGCPFCGEVDWLPVGVSPLPVFAGGEQAVTDVFVVTCRSCGFEWTHSVESIRRMARKQGKHLL